MVLGGRGKPQTSILNRGVWSFLDDDEIEGYTYDLDRAKELMAEAGSASGAGRPGCGRHYQGGGYPSDR